MIQDGIDYGEGYEQATEPGPDVEILIRDGVWVPRICPDLGLDRSGKYRRPIKLRVGERYRMRNGLTVEIDKYLPECGFPYRSQKGYGYRENGRVFQGNTADALDIIEHIPKQPKEKPMNEKMIEVNAWCAGTECKSRVEVTLAEAERLGEEAKRIKAENEIKVGDWIFCKYQKLFLKVSRVAEYTYRGTNDFSAKKSVAVKITNPSLIQALTEMCEAHGNPGAQGETKGQR